MTFPPSEHVHDYVNRAGYANVAGSADIAVQANIVTWGGVQEKPDSYPPSDHNHDNRYFTETEVKNLLWSQCMTREYEADNITLNTDPHTQTFSGIAVSGYWIAGIVSVAVDNASNGGTLSSKVRVYGFWYNQTEAWVRVRNTATSNAKVNVKIKVLYWKDPR